jgi:ATP-dependent RNA helicase RhlE
MQTLENAPTFNQLNLPIRLLKMLQRLEFTTPTPIQIAAIPVALKGGDMIGIAQTGTGKTLAFALPMMARLGPGKVGLIMAPTRELAIQIQDTYRKLEVKTALLIGGAPVGAQIRELRANPSVIVATPGRILDILAQRHLSLKNVQIVVLDEADMMLDMGFAPAIRRVLEQTPRDKQTLLFSATLPKEIEDIAANYLLMPEKVEVDRAGNAAETVSQELVWLAKENKNNFLEDLLIENKGSILVFARTRHGARKLAKTVSQMGHTVAEIHSDRSLAQRREALNGFKGNKYRILVATDIAARGIDVKGIELVINYDVPDQAEDYVHRIGRTGRAGLSGHAITLATPEQVKLVAAVEKVISAQLPISERSQIKVSMPELRGVRKPVPGASGHKPVHTPRVHAPAPKPKPPTKPNKPYQGDRSAQAGQRPASGKPAFGKPAFGKPSPGKPGTPKPTNGKPSYGGNNRMPKRRDP